MIRPCLIAFLLLFGFAQLADAQQRLAVLTEPGTPVVATEFLLTVGPLDEDPEHAGITYLAARSIARPLRLDLDSLGVRLNITPDKDAISFTIVAAPDSWEAASELVVATLLREPPDSVAFLRERVAIASELRGRSANPADAATREIDRAFYGAEHPWGRSTVGTPASMSEISFAAVRDFLREQFTPDRLLIAVAGPVDAASVRGHLTGLIGTALPTAVDSDAIRTARRPVREDYNSITTWVSASYPFPVTADQEAIGMFAFLAADALSFSPSQRSVYNVTSQVTRRAGAGELRLQIVIPPEEAEEWEERMTELAEDLQSRTLPSDVFQDQVRRYRGERLMSLLSPEDRAHFAARQLLVEGRFESLLDNGLAMTQERVREAARALGDPSIVLLGPNLDN